MVVPPLLFCVLVDLRDDQWSEVGVIGLQNVVGANWFLGTWCSFCPTSYWIIWCFCSPLGVISKGLPNTFWLLRHMSCPRGVLVKLHLVRMLQVSYTSFDMAVRGVLHCARGSMLAKVLTWTLILVADCAH